MMLKIQLSNYILKYITIFYLTLFDFLSNKAALVSRRDLQKRKNLTDLKLLTGSVYTLENTVNII